MSKLTLYSTNCPKCKVVEMKLKQKNIAFDIVTDLDTVVKVGETHNILSAPILCVDDQYFDFANAINYIKEVK